MNKDNAKKLLGIQKNPKEQEGTLRDLKEP